MKINNSPKFINVGSGSKGNASFLMYKDSLIQIDMGLSLSRVKASLDKLGKDIEDIDGLFITHNHNDHIKGLNLYHDCVPIYASKNSLGDRQITNIRDGDKIKIKDIVVEVVKTSHDAPNPVGFLFHLGDIKFAYITDTGVLPIKTKKKITNCDYYVFESNHDVDTLENSGRPDCLINRILGKKGHLSNAQSANYLVSLIGDKTKKIALAHLSEDCNTPSIALQTHLDIYKLNKIDVSKIEIFDLKQNEETVVL